MRFDVDQLIELQKRFALEGTGAPWVLRWYYMLCAAMTVIVPIQAAFALGGVSVEPGVALPLSALVLAHLANAAAFAVFARGIFVRARWVPWVLPWHMVLVHFSFWLAAQAAGVEWDPKELAIPALGCAVWLAFWTVYLRRPAVAAWLARR